MQGVMVQVSVFMGEVSIESSRSFPGSSALGWPFFGGTRLQGVSKKTKGKPGIQWVRGPLETTGIPSSKFLHFSVLLQKPRIELGAWIGLMNSWLPGRNWELVPIDLTKSFTGEPPQNWLVDMNPPSK